MSDRLDSVMGVHEIGVASYRKTKQNLAPAFSFKGVGVVAVVTGLVNPVWAMIAMISSVTAMLANSFVGRLLRGEARGREPDSRGSSQGTPRRVSIAITRLSNP